LHAADRTGVLLDPDVDLAEVDVRDISLCPMVSSRPTVRSARASATAERGA
jgi:hypothetical protein